MAHIPRLLANALDDVDASLFNDDLSLFRWQIQDFEEIDAEPFFYGSFSNVYKVRDVADKRILVKKVNENLDSEREVKILMHLKSRYVIELVNFRKTTGLLPELYFPYYENTFEDIYLELITYDARFYIRKILQAIHHCHSSGVIHGDIKPANIVVNQKEMDLRLIDFGSAQWYRGETSSVHFEGTKNYAAPECLLGASLDHGIDIWAVGVILLEMIFTKKHHFDVAQIQQVKSEFEGDLPKYKEWKHLKELLLNLLEYDNTKRITAQKAISSYFN